MELKLTPETIKEIADQLDSGMVCFYNKLTHEIESYPDMNRYATSFDEEMWQDVIDKVDENFEDYLKFPVLESHESFQFMERFIDQITVGKIQSRLAQAVQMRKPFRQFRDVLDDYPDVLQEWYAFKTQCPKEYVEEVVGEYNREHEEEAE